MHVPFRGITIHESSANAVCRWLPPSNGRCKLKSARELVLPPTVTSKNPYGIYRRPIMKHEFKGDLENVNGCWEIDTSFVQPYREFTGTSMRRSEFIPFLRNEPNDSPIVIARAWANGSWKPDS
jgi:hypothetical protein